MFNQRVYKWSDGLFYSIQTGQLLTPTDYFFNHESGGIHYRVIKHVLTSFDQHYDIYRESEGGFEHLANVSIMVPFTDDEVVCIVELTDYYFRRLKGLGAVFCFNELVLFYAKTYLEGFQHVFELSYREFDYYFSKAFLQKKDD
jgi:hypothetical protein